MTGVADLAELDPFELPEWLGESDVSWSSEGGLRHHLVTGVLAAGGAELGCDLLAVDQAYPAPVVGEVLRSRVHQVWQHGEVLLVLRDGRPTVATPGTAFTAGGVLDTFTRVARAVGADPARWSVRLGLARR